MSDLNSRPLYTLTIGEYIELTRKIFSEEAIKLMDQQHEPSKPEEENDTIFTEAVMKLTGYRKATLYTKVSRYEIPVLSRYRPLTFSRAAILQWIKDGKPNVIDQQAEAFLNDQRKMRYR